MVKLVAAVLMVGLCGGPAFACRENEKSEDEDDDDDDDDDDSPRCERGEWSGPDVMHIRIHGPILTTRVREAPRVAMPPPPPPPPPRAPLPPRVAAAPMPPPTPPPPSYEAPAATTVYTVSQPREPHIGVGVRASALKIGRNGPDAAGVGALLRFRTRPIELELEVGRDEYQGDRSDTRLGATLYVPLVTGRWIPFLLVGTGVNFSYTGVTGDEVHQGFLAGGAGLGFQINERFALNLDGRYLLRETFEGGERDQAVELRLTGMVYF